MPTIIKDYLSSSTSSATSSASGSGGRSASGSTSTSASSFKKNGNIGAALGGKTKTALSVSMLRDTAKSYGQRERFGLQLGNPSVKEEIGEKGAGGKMKAKILGNLRKSFNVVRRPSQGGSMGGEALGTKFDQTKVLYSTPAERSWSASRPQRPRSPINGTPLPHHTHIASIQPPTVAQIALGLHTSRTPHTRAIHNTSNRHPPGLGRHHSHTKSVTPSVASSRGYKAERVAVIPQRSKSQQAVQTRSALRTPTSSFAGSSASLSSRKTVRFDDSPEALD